MRSLFQVAGNHQQRETGCHAGLSANGQLLIQVAGHRRLVDLLYPLAREHVWYPQALSRERLAEAARGYGGHR